MSKKLTIFVVGLILLVSVVAFWKISTNKLESKKNIPASGSAQNNSQTPKVVPPVVKTEDSDLEEMESDLKTIDDDDFNEAELSDENVGL